jgi:aspartyl-tRNA(Asn)/glutamyl-tRNA(Gln) amidotransferase subunit A
MDDNLSYCSIAEASRRFRSRELSPVELTLHLIERIERLDPLLRAFLTPTPERALREARYAEGALLRGDSESALLGIPVAYKDIYATAGIRTTAGSKLLSDWVPDEDATCVQRWQDAGTVMLGKLITHEFAIGLQEPEHHFPAARNPWDLSRVPGGSSSGSGAALAAGLCLGVTGSDTGGSIRGPASFCGISGLKPTYGRCSRAGVVPLSWTLDHTGPMARSAEDCALLLQAMAGYDPRDPASSHAPVDNYTAQLSKGVRGLRIGVVRQMLPDDLDAETRAGVEEAARAFAGAGATVNAVDIPLAASANASLIMMVEAFAYHEDDLRTRPRDFGRGARRGFASGALYTATEYMQAQRQRSLLQAQFADALREVDLLITPSTPKSAATFEESYAPELPKLGSVSGYTSVYNLTGLPALAIPCGFSETGLPLSVQIAGRPFDEATVLRAGHTYQQLTDWHLRHPVLEEAVVGSRA